MTLWKESAFPGTLAGPDLLLRRQRGKIDTQTLKAKWKAISEAESENLQDGWPWNMKLPCRGCSDGDKRGKEVRKPLSAFACRDAGYGKAWAEISKGQHLLCPACKRNAGMTMDSAIMFCDACGTLKAKMQFSDDERERWKDDAQKGFTCKRCEGQRKAKECFECVACGRHWLLSGFDGQEQLKNNDDRSLATMTCYRCVALKSNAEFMQKKRYCQGCKQSLPWSAYDPILLGCVLRNQGQRGFAASREVYCDACKYPPCGRCAARPWKPPSASHVHDGQYICSDCRFPPCAGGCGTPRPQHSAKCSVFHMPTWICEKCRCPPCTKCSARPPQPPKPSQFHEGDYVCQSCWFPPCAAGCGTPRPQSGHHSVFKMPTWTCEGCRWSEAYEKAKEHLNRTGKMNRWLRYQRLQCFSALPKEQKLRLRQLPQWTDP